MKILRPQTPKTKSDLLLGVYPRLNFSPLNRKTGILLAWVSSPQGLLWKLQHPYGYPQSQGDGASPSAEEETGTHWDWTAKRQTTWAASLLVSALLPQLTFADCFRSEGSVFRLGERTEACSAGGHAPSHLSSLCGSAAWGSSKNESARTRLDTSDRTLQALLERDRGNGRAAQHALHLRTLWNF